MPAPKNPNTAAATAALRRKAQERKADELRAAGWTVNRNPYAIETYSLGPDSQAVLYGYRDGRALTALVCVDEFDYQADPDGAEARSIEIWHRFKSEVQRLGQDVGDGAPYVAGHQVRFWTDEVVIKVTNRKTRPGST